MAHLADELDRLPVRVALELMEVRAEGRVEVPAERVGAKLDLAAVRLDDVARHAHAVRAQVVRRQAVRVAELADAVERVRCGADGRRRRRRNLGDRRRVAALLRDPQLGERAVGADRVALQQRALVRHVDKVDEVVVGGPRCHRARHGRLEVVARHEVKEDDVLAEAREDRVAQRRVPRVADAAAEPASVARVLWQRPQETQRLPDVERRVV
eukprot:6574009-Prymnesium_polylepis.1